MISYTGGIAPRVMVTGASGFVGRALVRRLLVEQDQSSIFAVQGPSCIPYGLAVDLRSEDACRTLVQQIRPTVIIHLAASSSVGKSQYSPQDTWQANFDGTFALARAVLSLGQKVRFIFASSSEVYGENFNRGPCDETVGLAPSSPYARTKAACEYLLNDLSSETFEVVVLRLFNHSGPGQDQRFVLPSLAAQVAQQESTGQAGQIRVGNTAAIRDFTDVEDVIDAYLAVVRHVAPLPPFSIFNVGSGASRSIRSVVDRLVELASVPISVISDPSRMRPSEIAVAEGIFDKFRMTFGWTAVRSFDATIADVLNDQRKRLARSEVTL